MMPSSTTLSTTIKKLLDTLDALDAPTTTMCVFEAEFRSAEDAEAVLRRLSEKNLTITTRRTRQFITVSTLPSLREATKAVLQRYTTHITSA